MATLHNHYNLPCDYRNKCWIFWNVSPLGLSHCFIPLWSQHIARDWKNLTLNWFLPKIVSGKRFIIFELYGLRLQLNEQHRLWYPLAIWHFFFIFNSGFIRFYDFRENELISGSACEIRVPLSFYIKIMIIDMPSD